MDEKKLNHKPHVGGDPVKAEPNHDREKTYQPSNPPKKMQEEKTKLPEGETREKASEDMGEATDRVRKRL